MNAIVTASTALPSEDGQSEQQQYLTFQAADETFAIGILSIREIIQCGAMTQVPRMPAFIRGVINLRGAVVPVIDLNARFGAPATVINRRACIIIVEVDYNGHQHVIGVMVTAVHNVLEIPPDQIEPSPEFGSSIRAEFISGMGKVDGRFVMILDVSQVLSLEEIATLAATGGTP
ncbi:MAG: purine-binding chemotaxis protein CheW [Methylococcaceae bacterium]|nr:MAG: purine-binding chemotaxis protein CheW [Methylococcaceae bacterium]